jgi:hypothetical protein
MIPHLLSRISSSVKMLDRLGADGFEDDLSVEARGSGRSGAEQWCAAVAGRRCAPLCGSVGGIVVSSEL